MSKPFIPRPYQILIARWILTHPRCAIWAFMGAGKSAAVIWALDILSMTETVYPVLIIAPLRVAQSTWPDELRKWSDFSHLRMVAIVGNKDQRTLQFCRKAEFYTINVENIPWLVEHCRDVWPFKTIVFDEATRLAGFRITQGTARAGALKRVSWDKVTRFIELTGTPAPNGLQACWGMSWFLDQGERLGRSFDAFSSRWFGYQRIQDAISHKVEIKPVIMPFASEQIQSRLKDICLSLKSEDWFPVTEPVTTIIRVDLPTDAAKLYRQMEKDFYIEIEQRGIEAFNAGVKTNKLAQLANGAAYLDNRVEDADSPKEWREVHDVKIQALQSIVLEASGAPVMVAYNFRSDLARILKAFPKALALDKKPGTITAWNEGQIPILVAHPASAGHGLNLARGGNILVYFSSSWDLEQDMQIQERIGPVRQAQEGLNRNVLIYRIVARRTVDELILKRLESKRSVQDILLEAMKRR